MRTKLQFEVYKTRDLADVRKVPSIPHESLYSEYEYFPMPAEFIPPVGSNLLLHLYEHPDHAEDTGLLLRRIPKKLRRRLEPSATRGSSLGWGLQFVEGLDWHKLLLYSFCGFLASLVVGVGWASAKGDVQGGFGIAAVLLTFMVLVVSIVQTGLEL